MAISRLQAALAAATSEVTVAAANLNFDFTLVKYEAPKEYQPLGNILSTKRKDSAELGSSHKLARQLGALFEDVCPPAPRLLEAYGKRASEIAKASQNTSDSYTGTLFEGFAGIDGTSIWAAATSSKAALHVHLLASLLARMWTAPEAISIWVELVAERRKDIANRMEEGEPVKFSLAAAVGQEITRSQLAAWDASARAWLRTADKVFERKQKQLELILKNIHLSVSGDSEVFTSVIGAWVTATETMERLIAGMPQAVQDGAPLLGLSAWHLYPDMGVFSPEVVEIKMDDPLVAAGGFLSIGLATTPRTSGENDGIYWSLSLAQLRFYGRPVKVERALETGSRITFPQLNLVLFGILLAEWRMSDSDGDVAAETIVSLADYVNRHQQGSDTDRRLLKMLRDSSVAFSERTTGDKELNAKLIQLGRRRAQNMVHGDGLASKTEITPVFFNLLQPLHVISALRDRRSQILFMRHVAKSSALDGIPADALIIRVPIRMAYSPQLGRHNVDDHDGFDPVSPSGTDIVTDDYASASEVDTPMEDAGLYEGPTSTDGELPMMATVAEDSTSDFGYESEAESDFSDGYKAIPEQNEYMYTTALPMKSSGIPGTADTWVHHSWLPDTSYVTTLIEGETVTFDAHEKFRSWEGCIQIVAAKDPEAYIYHPIMGDPSQAALFVRRLEFEKLSDLSLNLQHLLWSLEHDLIDPAEVVKRLCRLYATHQHRLSHTLQILARVATVYDDLLDMTIDIGVLNRPVIGRRWAKEILNGLDRASTFSIISYFESGIHDVDPTQMDSVIALSSADSLFVCRPVSEDACLDFRYSTYFSSYLKIHTSPFWASQAFAEFLETSESQVLLSCCLPKSQ
jgi:hypothetical protein